jgi:hypothetical protein
MKTFPVRARITLQVLLLALGAGAILVPLSARSGPTRTAEPVSFREGLVERSRYIFGWNGIPAAVAEFTLSRQMKDGRPILHFQGNARTTEAVDTLWRMRDSVVAHTDAATYVPRRFEMFRRENDEKVDTLIVHDFDESKLRVQRMKRGTLRKGSFPAAGLYDPVSAMLLLRSDSLAPGATRKVRVTEGKRIYDVVLRVLSRERIRIDGKEIAALKLSAGYSALDGSTSSVDDGIRRAFIWVSDDDRHQVLRVEAEAPVGIFFGERVG